MKNYLPLAESSISFDLSREILESTQRMIRKDSKFEDND